MATSKINYNLFPTLVSVYEEFLNRDECLEIFDLCLNSEYSNNLIEHSELSGNALSTHNKDNFINYIDGRTHLQIKNRLQNSLNEYRLESGDELIELGDSWFNVTQKGGSLISHVHSNSVLSGALYINVDDKSSKLYFYNPNQHVHFSTYSNLTYYNHEHFSFVPTNGTLIIFPSWLRHGSHNDVNRTENRLVVSFNTTARSSVG